ncbi:MAG: hypothetical protein R2753_18110 [Chitinophagales bacterium]
MAKTTTGGTDPNRGGGDGDDRKGYLEFVDYTDPDTGLSFKIPVLPKFSSGGTNITISNLDPDTELIFEVIKLTDEYNNISYGAYNVEEA